ncbi:MAG: hypothetical protein LBV16_09445, partial [Elusimicrobiota bacterium]|nr:hypothetical protein [Elusimicrobiota bacterium]
MALLKRLFKSFIYFAFLFVLLSLWKADGAFALNEGQFASYFVDNGDVFDMQLDTNLTFSGKPLLVMNPSSGTIRGENLTSSVSLGNNPGLSDPGLRIGSNRQLFFYGNIVFVNVGRYGAIRVDGNSRVFFRNSTVGFAGNTAASRGGAVLIDGSNLFFENSTVSWTGNMGSSYGGAIYSYQSTVAFTNSSASFISNSANIGAAIRNTAGHNFTFDNSRADFISNTAGSQGGAIANYRLSFTISNSTVSFISNSASSYGGAVDNEGQSIFTVADSAVGFTSNSANSGAGIYNRQSTFTFADSSVSFNSNSAQSGGAIYNSSSNFTFINSIVRFNSNSASDSINGGGGATYNRDYSLFTIANSTINFTSNKASIGGAIYNENQSTFTFTNSIVSFTSNSGSGGAIYNYDARFVFTNSTVSWTENKSGNAGGGAISNEDLSIFTITNSSASFTLNTTDFFGGAINNDKQSTFTFANSIVSFTSNSVGDGIGGALFNGAQSTFTFINSIVRFNSNYTNILGGAIGNFQSIFTFTSSTVSFISNFARDSGGGAIISAESTLTFSNSIVSFISNSAVYGGAILSSHSSIFIFTNSTVSFISNSANIAGGAVYLRGENLSFNNSSISWTGNSASNAGGALYIGVSSVSFNDSYVYFDSNISSGAPNDLYIQDSRLKINGGRVIVNSGIEGTSTSIIYVDKSVIFELRGFSDKYVGNINVINGRVKVGGIYIAGDTFLQTANSVIELTTGTQITADSTIFFSDINSKMYITNNSSTIVFHTDAVISSGGLSYGRITKTGGGVLRIGGDNRLFGGDYTQTKGLTIVDNSGRIFSGKIEIENSSITAYGTGINYGDLRLINGYAQNYASVSGAVISENNTQLQTHSKIDFKGMSGVIMYELRGVRLVGGSTDENAIKFEGVKVGVSSVPDSSLSSGKVSFHFENSVLALSKTALSNNASVKAGLSSVRDLSLSKISANISSISFGVDFTATAMTSDRLITTADSLTLFGIDQIHILNIYRGETLNISTENFISEVFPTASNAAFVSGAQYSYSESSTVYSFESHDNGLGGNLRFIRLKDKTVVTGDFDLLYCNNVTGAFGVGASSFSIGANRGYTFNRDETYNIISKANWDISATGTGDFRIEGNGDPEKRVISARRRDNLAEQSSLFNLAQSGIKFNVSQVSIIDAYRADGGAAIRMTADNIISLENVIFSKNTSVLGGAIYAEDGKINFTNASKFSENTALTNGGGAIYGQGISVDYEGSLDFSNNISLSSGGFAYFKDSANSFMLVDAVFERNTAKNGGALYIEGGNIYSLDPNNKLTFRGNIAREKGGAAYIIGAAGRSSTFDIGADNVLLAMTNNSAISGGGAIYFDGSNGSNLVLTNPNFTDNNSLLGNGGAIYAFGGAQISTLTIRARQDILFSRNLAGGNPNDIYLGTNMDLIFDSVKKTKIRLDGGIDSAAGASTIIKKGAGEVSVGSFLYYSGMLIIEQGKFHINMSSSNLGALNVIENGELSLINNYADGGKRNIVDIAGDAVITGQYALDLNFSYPEYTDRIIVHGNLKIVENISLLKTYLWGGTEYVAIGNKVMIAESDNEIIGQFSQVDGRAGRVLWLRKGKDDNDRQWQLWLEVTGIIDFRSIAMTHNQSEVAMLFNKDALWESSMVNIPNLIGDMFFDKK